MFVKVAMLVLFFGVMIGVGLYCRKNATDVNGFVLGGRSVGPWLTAFAYGTSYFSAVVFVGYAGQFGWKYGIAATWAGIGNALLGSLLAWAVLGRRTRIMTQHLDSATMPEFFGKRFGSRTLKLAASAVIFIFLIPYTASLYNGLSRLFGMAFDIDYAVCVIVMAILTGVYVIAGGYMATAINDFVQGIIMLVGIVAVIVLVAIALFGTVFRVHAIHVSGNTTVTDEAIIRLSGLKIGQSSMTIDDEEVMRKIESNRYLRCTLVDVQWNAVTLHVKERVPAVYINHNGMIVTLDNRGFVLEESLASETGFESLVKVSGMNVRRCALGQQIALQSASQLEAYTQILVELKAMKGIDLLRELDMSSMDSIYLTTRDDFFVRLGSEDDLHAKLRAFLITREKVLQMGYAKGTIDVTDPGRPTYLP